LRDAKFHYRGSRPVSQNIVIVDIDSASLEQIGRWPWRRDILKEVIEEVFSNGAQTVGLDIVFSESQQSVPEELAEILRQQKMKDLVELFDFDKHLAATFKKYHDRLISSWLTDSDCRPRFSAPGECPVADPDAIASLPSTLPKFAVELADFPPGFDFTQTSLGSAVTVTPNLEILDRAVDRSGFVNAVRDPDGLTRHSRPFLLVNGKAYPSLPLQMAQQVRNDRVQLAFTPGGLLSEMAWEKTGKSIPTTPLGTWNIGFLGPDRHFKYVSARELFAKPEDRTIASLPSVFQDAIVIIGVSALAVGDLVATPFTPIHPGTEVQATILENLLNDSLIDIGSGKTVWILLIAMIATGLMTAFVGMNWEAIPAMAFSLAVVAAGAVIDFQFLFSDHWDFNTGFWYAQMLGGLGITWAGRYIMEQQDKKFVQSAFSKYVAPAVVDNILRDPKSLSLGGRRETMTILFSDIRGFTTLSEKLDAKTVAEFLNDYLDLQTEVAFEHGGTLDKYIGDALMAFWGAPLPQADHALRACNAAIAMAKALDENRERYLSKYGIGVFMGIGLHSGEVSVGNMGSLRSFSYTVIGDNVNLASRLEGATKYFGVEILTTRGTLDCIEAAGGTPPAHRSLAVTQVKGKKNGVEVIELLRDGNDDSALEAFQQGVSHYRKRKWKLAMACFEKSAQGLGKKGKPDLCSEKYLEQCRAFAKKAPPAKWDGSWALTDK